MYADDTQPYLPFALNSSDEITGRPRIELCINDIKIWMSVSKVETD